MMPFYTYLQTDNLSTWERVLERWGWPAFFLALVLAVIYIAVRATWPLAKSYIVSLQKNLDESQAMIKEQIHLANLRSQTKDKEFLDALEQQRESHERLLIDQSRKHAEAMTEHALILKDIGNTVAKISNDCDEIRKNNK